MSPLREGANPTPKGVGRKLMLMHSDVLLAAWQNRSGSMVEPWWNRGGTAVEPWWNRLHFGWNRGLAPCWHHVFLHISRARFPDRLPPL